MTTTETKTTLYDALRLLIEYPAPGHRERLLACREVLLGASPDAAKFIEPFFEFVSAESPAALEEMYTQTFDFDPDCSLDLGWHLYGENYERGDFLVKMRDLLQRFDIPETTELPDHLSHVLPAFGKLSPDEAREFATRYVVPALGKLMEGLSKKTTPYKDTVKFICHVLQECHTGMTGETNHE